MDAHIKKPSIVEAAKVLLREGVKKRFPTYDAAIAEIERLESALNRLAANKPRRGRPKVQSPEKEIAQILKAFPSLPAWICGTIYSSPVVFFKFSTEHSGHL